MLISVELNLVMLSWIMDCGNSAWLIWEKEKKFFWEKILINIYIVSTQEKAMC